mgnify:CR=1 FL=1
MRRAKLDRVDRRILQALQDDGRMTNVDLARRAEISAPPCLRRVRALEEAGYIRGYHADINAEALGFGVTVFAQVGPLSQAETDLQAFEALMQSWPEVREVPHAGGRDRFPAAHRRRRLGCLSALPDDPADRRPQRHPRQIIAGDPHLQERCRECRSATTSPAT